MTAKGRNNGYDGVRVAILGASGFIGRSVARALCSEGAHSCLVVRNRAFAEAIFSKEGIDGDIFEMDLRDSDAIGELFRKMKPSITFNLAGYGVDRSERDEKTAYQINAHLVQAICEAVAEIRDPEWLGQDVIHVGSASEYSAFGGNLSEDSDSQPTTLYGQSKLAGTHLLEGCCKTHRLKGLTARLFTVYGPGEHQGRLLPSLREAARTGMPLRLTAGIQKRDFTYVKDVAEGLVRLGLATTEPGFTVNLSTGHLTSVLRFAETAAGILGIPTEQMLFGSIPYHYEEMEHSEINLERLRRLIAWTPPTGIAEGIRQTHDFENTLNRAVGLSSSRIEMSENSRSLRPSHSGQPDLSLAIPCYNESDVIRNTVTRLVASFRERDIDLELVLVDNGSADDTGEIIDELIDEGLPIVKETVEVNQGYGNGVLHGLRSCQGRFVGIICADGQVEAQDVVKVYEIAANAKTPKLVKVRRRFRLDGLVRKIVSIFYNLIAIILFGRLGSIDINGNPKIFPREYLELMNLESKDWFLDAEVMIKAKRLGLEVLEFNVMAQMREGGTSHVRPGTCWEFVVNLFKFRIGGRGRVQSEPHGTTECQVVPNEEKNSY